MVVRSFPQWFKKNAELPKGQADPEIELSDLQLDVDRYSREIHSAKPHRYRYYNGMEVGMEGQWMEVPPRGQLLTLDMAASHMTKNEARMLRAVQAIEALTRDLADRDKALMLAAQQLRESERALAALRSVAEETDRQLAGLLGIAEEADEPAQVEG